MWSALVDWFLGRGRRVPREGPAHSSDRHGFWKDLWQLRRVLADAGFEIDTEHSGSVDIYDYLGCLPYNDNDIKRERRDAFRLVVFVGATSKDDVLAAHCKKLLRAFDKADAAKGWRDA